LVSEAITLLIKQEPELDSMQETGYKSLSMRNQSSTVVLDLTEFTGSQGKSKRLSIQRQYSKKENSRWPTLS
jgi:hypothetical protein